MSIYSEIFIVDNKEEKEDIYLIKIGKNAESNDKLLKNCPKDCLWFHLKGGPSPHGFLIFEGEKKVFHPKAILRTASLVKSFSKSRDRKEVSVEYTFLKNIELTNILGLVEINKKMDKVFV